MSRSTSASDDDALWHGHGNSLHETSQQRRGNNEAAFLASVPCCIKTGFHVGKAPNDPPSLTFTSSPSPAGTDFFLFLLLSTRKTGSCLPIHLDFISSCKSCLCWLSSKKGTNIDSRTPTLPLSFAALLFVAHFIEYTMPHFKKVAFSITYVACVALALPVKREVPQGMSYASLCTNEFGVNFMPPTEHSHEQFLTSVSQSLQANNPDGILDSVFGLLGAAAASQGAGKITVRNFIERPRNTDIHYLYSTILLVE